MFFNLPHKMYGRYTKDLGEYAKNEARKLQMLERRRKKEDKARNRVTIFIIILLQWSQSIRFND